MIYRTYINKIPRTGPRKLLTYIWSLIQGQVQYFFVIMGRAGFFYFRFVGFEIRMCIIPTYDAHTLFLLFQTSAVYRQEQRQMCEQ